MVAFKGVGGRPFELENGGPQLRLLQHIVVGLCAFAASVGAARAQEHIGSAALAHNDVTRELAGAAAPLAQGDSVYRNEIVRTGTDFDRQAGFPQFDQSGRRPDSRVTLDQFV